MSQNSRRIPGNVVFRAICALAVIVMIVSDVHLRADEEEELISFRINPGGTRRFVPGRWAMTEARIWNKDTKPRSVLIVVTPPGTTHLQYAREITVPAGLSFVTQWPVRMPKGDEGNLEFLYQAYPSGQEDGIIRRKNNDPGMPSYNAIVEKGGQGLIGLLRSGTDDEEQEATVDEFLRTLAVRGRGAEGIVGVQPFELSGQPECLDVYDQLGVTASDLALYPDVCESVRLWVQRGGRLIIFVDHVGASGAELLLGEAATLTVVGETSSNTVTLQLNPEFPEILYANREVKREFEEPVHYVRMQTSGASPIWSVDGWPVVSQVPVGKGHIIISAISAEVLYQPNSNRTEGAFRNELIASSEEMFNGLFGPAATDRLSIEQLQEQAATQVGYEIPSRTMALLITIAFPVLLLAGGLVLLKRQAGERLIWILPLLAIAVALPGVISGLSARTVAPQTVVRTEIIHSVPGQNLLVSDGYALMYNPEPTELTVSARDGSTILPVANDINMNYQRLVWDGIGLSHWGNFVQPSGIHATTIRQVRHVEPTLQARATFDASGLVGMISAPEEWQPSDAILLSALPEQMAVTVRADHSFHVGPSDLLAHSTFVTDNVLSEAQAARAKVMQHVVAPVIDGRVFPASPSIVYWANADSGVISIGDEDTRHVDSLLVVQPLELTPPAANTQIMIPAGMLPFDIVADTFGGRGGYNKSKKSWLERKEAGATRLEFTIPSVCLPFHADSAVVSLQLHAPSRDLRVLAGSADDMRVVQSWESPVGNYEIPIDAERLQSCAAFGRVWIEIQAGDVQADGDDAMFSDISNDSWTVERIDLTLIGKRIPADAR